MAAAFTSPNAFRRLLATGLALGLAAFLAACSSSNSDDGTGVGPDRDRDGVADAADNCPDDVNTRQFDSDSDGIGNACDNCPSFANPDQTDLDANGIGDACEGGDQDGDGLADIVDNCIAVFNPDQADNDLDGNGDLCDPDDDNDGIVDANDPDRDGDGVANTADSNADSRFECRDVDGDECDDCASGVDDPANDGPDSNSDGYCDLGVHSARLTVRVTASRAVFGVDVAVVFDRSRVTIFPVDPVTGVGPFDEDNYFPSAPDIAIGYDASTAGRVNIVGTFGTFSPDPSFVTPADVFAIDFTYESVTPSLDDFGVLTCEAVDIASDPILGATCTFSDLELGP